MLSRHQAAGRGCLLCVPPQHKFPFCSDSVHSFLWEKLSSVLLTCACVERRDCSCPTPCYNGQGTLLLPLDWWLSFQDWSSETIPGLFVEIIGKKTFNFTPPPSPRHGISLVLVSKRTSCCGSSAPSFLEGCRRQNLKLDIHMSDSLVSDVDRTDCAPCHSLWAGFPSLVTETNFTEKPLIVLDLPSLLKLTFGV